MNPKMNRKTLEQVLNVLRKMQQRYMRGESIKEAYLASAEAVSKDHGVRLQTIFDACCRRLGLDTDSFRKFVADWMEGNPFHLAQAIKLHTSTELHEEIDDFLTKSDGVAYVAVRKDPQDTEVLNIQIDKGTMLQLRMVAEIEGKKVERWIEALVKQTVTPLFIEKFTEYITKLPAKEREQVMEMIKKATGE